MTRDVVLGQTGLMIGLLGLIVEVHLVGGALGRGQPLPLEALFLPALLWVVGLVYLLGGLARSRG